MESYGQAKQGRRTLEQGAHAVINRKNQYMQQLDQLETIAETAAAKEKIKWAKDIIIQGTRRDIEYLASNGENK